jgi:hypothetical protein
LLLKRSKYYVFKKYFLKKRSCASGVAVSAVNVEQNQVKTGKEKTILDMNKQGYESVPFVVNDNVSLPEEKSKTYEMLPEQAKDYSGILFVSNNVADGMRGYKFRVDINSVQKEGVGGIGLVKISCDPGAELYMVYTGNLCGATSRIDLAGTGFTFSNTRGGGVLNFAVKGKGKIYFEFVVSLPASESSATGKSKVLLYKGVTFDAKE